MARTGHQQPAAFVGDHLEQVVDDDPSKRTVDGFCHQCQHVSNVKCGACGSTDVSVDNPAHAHSAAKADKFRQLLLAAQAHPNSKYFLGCALIALGDPAAQGQTMTEFGEHWKVGRAAVSKTANLIRLMLGLPPSQYMKSEKSRAVFRQSNRRPRRQK